LVIAALAAAPALAGPTRGRDLPHRYLPNSLDGRLEQITSPYDGRAWAAWSYRNGGEYDVAVSFRDEMGFWSEPLLLGEDDGRDQSDPVLAADIDGTVYMAYAERSPDRIMLTWRLEGTDLWSNPTPLTANGLRAKDPALRIVGDRLVVAFRSGRGLVILDMPLVDPVMDTDIFNDGPDPIDVRPPEDEDDEDDNIDIHPLGGNSNAGFEPPGEEPVVP
jgi:hypothetical protein